jgi:hypothetical protein
MEKALLQNIQPTTITKYTGNEMNNINFNYWLQGYFELMGNQDGLAPSLSETQVKCIRDHLELVNKVEVLTGFASWLEGYLDAKISGPLDTQGYLAISGKLNDWFTHAVAQPSSSVIAGPGSGTITWPPNDYWSGQGTVVC